MSATNRPGQTARVKDDPEPHTASPVAETDSTCANPPFDWQVLLLRYLPQPVGSTHVIKRLAPR